MNFFNLFQEKYSPSLPTNERLLRRFLEAKTLNNHIYVKNQVIFFILVQVAEISCEKGISSPLGNLPPCQWDLMCVKI